jgi:TatD DNase family protein
MVLTDTHAHLYAAVFDEDREDMLARARASGVGAIFLPNVDSSTIEAMLALEAAHPDVCHAMMGLHPCSVGENYQDELALVRGWLEQRRFCAIGEIGLDFYWDKTWVPQQEEAFLQQVDWALEFDLPIAIHSRESTERILALLEPMRQDALRGVFHCFSGTLEQAQRAIALGFWLGIGGVLTFRNSGLAEVLSEIPLEHLVLETDAPYLAPTPFRGKRNESAYVALVAQRLAEVKGVDLATLARVSSENAQRLFGVGEG